MIEPYKFDTDHIILEPNGGKGDLLDVIRKRFDRNYDPKNEETWNEVTNLHTCEIEPELQAILDKKGYVLQGSDFLLYSPRVSYDFIFMNPPFKDFEKHLRHAWDILVSGDIACIVPTYLFDGKTIEERALCELISRNGTVEHLGNAFAIAERSTQIPVSIVRLHKGESNKIPEIDIDGTVNDREDPEFESPQGQEVGLNGFADILVSNFDAAIGAFAEYRVAREKLMRYQAGVVTTSYDRPLDEADKCEKSQEAYNSFVTNLNTKAWNRVMDHPKFQAILTERARKSMDAFRKKQRRLDFNRVNIEKMLYALVDKQDEFTLGAVLDAFDTLSRYHVDNLQETEGWMSNKCWKINHRVVLPYFISFSFGSFSMSYSRDNELNDVDRAMCIIGGYRYDDIVKTRDALQKHFNTYRPQSGGECESEFFEIKFYKKGTIHLKFKDRELLERFNYMAARGKMWLPPEAPAPRSKKYNPRPEPTPPDTDEVSADPSQMSLIIQ